MKYRKKICELTLVRDIKSTDTSASCKHGKFKYDDGDDDNDMTMTTDLEGINTKFN